MKSFNMKWTPGAIETIVNDWNAGKLSVTQIADKLGTTRNAVMGKIHRLRQAGVNIKEREVGKKPEGYVRPPRRPATYKHSSPLRGEKSVVGVVHPDPATPSPDHYVSIEELQRHHCREVVALKPKALYCGAQKQEKSSFCPFHHAKNWVPPRERLR